MTSVRSARDNAYDALQEFSRLSKLLLSSIVDVAEEREGPNPEDIMKKLLEADKKLQIAVHSCMYLHLVSWFLVGELRLPWPHLVHLILVYCVVKEEQVFHNKIEQLHKAIDSKEKQILVFTTHLKNADAKLNALLDTSYSSLQSLNLAQKNPASVEDLITYSHQVSRRMCDVPYPEVGLPQNVYPYPDLASIETTRLFRKLHYYAVFHLFQKEFQKQQKLITLIVPLHNS
jgi:hypothetical protein